MAFIGLLSLFACLALVTATVSSQFKSCFLGKKIFNHEGHEEHEEKNFMPFMFFMVNFSLVPAWKQSGFGRVMTYAVETRRKQG